MQWREIIINQTHVFEGILYDPPIHCYSYAEINLKSKSKTNVPFLFHSYTFLLPCKCSHLFLPKCWFSPWEQFSLKLFLVYFSGHCCLWIEVLQSVLIFPRVKYHWMQNCRGLLTDALGLLFSVPITHHALPFLASVTSRYFLEYVFWCIPSWLSSLHTIWMFYLCLSGKLLLFLRFYASVKFIFPPRQDFPVQFRLGSTS